VKAILGPYVGPNPLDQSRPIYGRDEEIRAICNLLMANRVVLLYSPSGAGKTSLVEAGLRPQLERIHVPVLPTMRLGGEPVESVPLVRRFVQSALGSAEEGVEKGEAAIPADRLAEMTLMQYLERRRSNKAQAQAGDRFASELLVFDQFEELMRADPNADEARRLFFDQLAEVLKDEGCWALFAMREEYVPSMEGYLERLPTRVRARFRLDLLNPEQAKAAIRNPARDFNVDFTEPAADKLINDLRRVRVQRADLTSEEQLGPYVEPLHLQVVCRKLWRQRLLRLDPITEDQISSQHGVDEALSSYYRDAVREAVSKSGVSERELRDWIERELIKGRSLRGQGWFDINWRAEFRRAVKSLIPAILREERKRGIWVELTHDRLIQPILDDNEQWRTQHRSQLERLAADWDAQQRKSSALRVGYELPDKEQLLREHGSSTGPLEDAFLKALDQEYQNDRALREQESQRRTNLADLGWAVIFPENADPAIAEALSPLLEWRKSKAGAKNAAYYHEFSGATGYHPGESVQNFLDRVGVTGGPVEPAKLPYYILIVGDPAVIPFEFQYGLDAQYAVGRIAFETVEEYSLYANSVVYSESQDTLVPRKFGIFAPQYESDVATRMAQQLLISPLLDRIAGRNPDWRLESRLAGEATKAGLRDLLAGADAPGLLFCISQAPTWTADQPEQTARQGELLCSDWPSVSRDASNPVVTFGASDVDVSGSLLGSVIFVLASNSAGTPASADFASSVAEPKTLARRPFLSRTAQHLLSHPSGGALAVIGHVEQAWAYSFVTERNKPDVSLFEELFTRLMIGYTVGAAKEVFNQRYTMLCVQLADQLRRQLDAQGQLRGDTSGQSKVSQLIVRTLDLRNYIVLGDPAVRLRIQETSSPVTRPILPLPVARVSSPRPAELIGNGVYTETGKYRLETLSVEKLLTVANVPAAGVTGEIWQASTRDRIQF
jgi:hypothetical protein